jgi:hypothetical protein
MAKTGYATSEKRRENEALKISFSILYLRGIGNGTLVKQILVEYVKGYLWLF